MPNKSTVTNLLLFEEYVKSSFKNGLQVDSIYIDIGKAFDSINLDLLVFKLNVLGFRDSLLN